MLGVILVTFLIVRLIPGDPCVTMLGERATPAKCEAFLERYGLNDNLAVQFVRYMQNLFTGDFGDSIRFTRPVTTLIAERLPLNEDAAWFGPLSVILLPIVVIVVLTGRQNPRKKYLLVSLLFLAGVFLSIAILITGWSPTNGRYLILPTLLIAPLYSVLLPRRRALNTLVTIVLGLIAGGLAFSSLLINDSRPLVTQYSLYTYQQEKLNRSDDAGFLSRGYTYINDRVIEDLVLASPDRKDILHQVYYENLFYQSAEDIPDVVFINAHVPPGEPLYALMQKSIIEYALFGVDKTRELHPVIKLDQVPAGALVLVDKQLVDTLPAGAQLIAENDHYRIMRKE